MSQANGRFGWKGGIPDLPGPDVPILESGRSLPEARTPDAAPISALPLVGRKA
jgi:hypothetical protein